MGARATTGRRFGQLTGAAGREPSGREARPRRRIASAAVLGVGCALGGIVGVGTVLCAPAIGPLVPFFLPLATVRLDARGVPGSVHYTDSPDLPAAEGA